MNRSNAAEKRPTNSRKMKPRKATFFSGGEDRRCKHYKHPSRYSCSCPGSGWSVSDRFCPLTAWNQTTFLLGLALSFSSLYSTQLLWLWKCFQAIFEIVCALDWRIWDEARSIPRANGLQVMI